MAQIDPNIILQIRQPQLADPMDVQSKLMALQANGMQLAQARREEQYNKTMGDLYRNNLGSDGKVNTQGVLQGMAQGGLGARIPAYQKQLAEADKARADLGKTTAETGKMTQDTEASKFKLLREKVSASNSVLSSLLSQPNVTHQDVIGGITTLVQRGYATPEEGVAMVRGLPGRPEDLRPYLMQRAFEELDAKQRLDAIAPKFEKIDTGGGVLTGTVNPLTGQFTQGGTIAKTATPGERMTDSRERFLVNQGVTYQTDENGNIVALPNKLGAGQSPTARPVLDASGNPVAGKSGMTEDQGKASGWLAQARNAYSNVLAALNANPTALYPGAGDALAAIPGFGAVGRSMQSADRQKFNQAVASMSEAFLRAATGAGINKDEAAQKIAELTPQFGDKPEVVKQKMDAIPMYLQSLELRAGPGARKVGAVQVPGNEDPTAQAGIPADVMAALKKHGYKGGK